ncbi:radical SAM protein [Brevundimonas sp.]|uniref:radical SAM/SPASM domain-containing protein n=1 Tax=Brevundimonas sp. TaxID=1871086 RepID=UPI001DB14C0F|nr:radical SAM protein [Brevundimonas sp.]MBA3999154.1 heme biosynthesis protein [Brevundimonas sp.]
MGAARRAAAVFDGDISRVVRQWRAGAPPAFVVWEITLKCDLACRHCGSRAGAERTDELSTAESLDVVRQLAELGVREVTLIGGEAYLREDWVDIAAAVTQSGMTCSMVTGGRGLDAWRLAEAAAAGVSQIGVSIDGIGLTHDKLRGAPGSYEAAVDCARRIAETPGIGLGVNTQINRLSAPELPALADVLVDIGVNAWQVQLTVPLGRAADRPELILQPYDLLEVMPILNWIKTRKLKGTTVNLVPGNNVGYFGPYERALRIGGEAGHLWRGCLAGQASLGLEADGKVKGCPSLPSGAYTGGNVRKESIETIWRSKSEVTGLGKRTREDLWGFCHGCEHADACLGGCTWTSHALFGRPGNNPYCHHRALELHSRGKRERLELIAAAPGLPFDHGRFSLTVEDDDGPSEGGDLRLGAMLSAILPADADGRPSGRRSPSSMNRMIAKRKPSPADPEITPISDGAAT